MTRGEESGRGAPRTPSRARVRTPASRSASARLASLVFAAGVAAVLAGCGESAQNKEAQQLENVSVLSSTAPLQSRIITQAELNAVPDGEAVRTFLVLWSRLQFESWPSAVELFEPALRDTIGDSTLVQALAADLAVWQGSKPGIINKRVTGASATIEFIVRVEKDQLSPSSITFKRSGKGWLVSYMSLLDSALQRSVQTRVQAAISPLGTKPAAEAVRQGYSALGLQSTYLQRELAAEARRKHGVSGP
jgi:hypothetical protein